MNEMISWKRLALASLSFGIGLAASGALISHGIRWNHYRARSVTNWTELEIPQLSAKALLRTQWRDANLKYQFRLLPSSSKTVQEFNSAFQGRSAPSELHLKLFDKEGFEICDTPIYGHTLQKDVDANGQVEGFSANGVAYGCYLDGVNRATEWKLMWRTSS
jgi:hypothetical protein